MPAELQLVFGEEVLDHTLVLLTCGDYLMGKTVEVLEVYSLWGAEIKCPGFTLKKKLLELNSIFSCDRMASFFVNYFSFRHFCSIS